MNEDNRIMTVEFLHKWLGELMDSGHGNMKIRCEDGYLHEDELGVDTYHNEARIMGMLFNLGDYALCSELKTEVEKAFERFVIRSRARYES